MENSATITAETDAKCASCFTKVATEDVFCTSCGYPLKGTESEQRSFIARQEVNNLDYADFNQQIKKAGNSLYYLAGIFTLSAIINYFRFQDNPDTISEVIIILILAFLFLGLGAYSSKKPLVCLVSGLVLYIIVQVLLAIDNPINIVSGIIFKIIIIGYLIKGIKSALDFEQFKKEHNIV
ncbi:hypothetical protein [Mucilaginibacter psychrotolerans]|uniref:Zinc ribbon domain-containing protein n=1 Tax=Mucilaginibacter psychrotolerans TaxID=1524096 RepID=A0A4Y8SJL7_9SPHI|nr:hypothetical protein [Mucilaginibacter psychrotolerans]TFF39239.1 hypothetical protein E2R66_06360 [Mucilaginibacter psychrotolerans]